MTYNKPSNITYSQMAIYVDTHIYEENHDEELCFKYLYFLSHLVALKGKYFKRVNDYDAFSIYCASQVFLRYRKKDLPPIKSCLNYIRRVAYPFKVEYQKGIFAQEFSNESMRDGNVKSLSYDENLKAINQQKQLLNIDSEYYLERISSVIREIVSKSPYSKDRLTKQLLYINCLLNLSYQLSLSNHSKRKKKYKENLLKLADEDIRDIYSKEIKNQKIILFHLDNSMSNEISILITKIKKRVVEDLLYLVHDYETDDIVLKNILASPLNGDKDDEGEE